MEMNLAQMQVIQSTIAALDSKYSPVVEYNGKIISADFYQLDQFDLTQGRYKSVDLNHIDAIESGNPVTKSFVRRDTAARESYDYISKREYKDVLDDKQAFFLFLEHVAYKFDRGTIPTDFLTNVKFLDGSVSSDVDMIRISSNPKFQFISLV